MEEKKTKEVDVEKKQEKGQARAMRGLEEGHAKAN